MPGLRMNPTDLGELYILLRVYIQCYGTGARDSELLSEIEEEYRIRYKMYYKKEAPQDITNPRSAGRKPLVDPALSKQVHQLRAEGKTIREIASQVNRSVGYVHKLIQEQPT